MEEVKEVKEERERREREISRQTDSFSSKDEPLQGIVGSGWWSGVSLLSSATTLIIRPTAALQLLPVQLRVQTTARKKNDVIFFVLF